MTSPPQEVSMAQKALLNYHPSLACGLTSVLTGLTLFYLGYANFPQGDTNTTPPSGLQFGPRQKVQVGPGERVQFVPKNDRTFTPDYVDVENKPGGEYDPNFNDDDPSLTEGDPNINYPTLTKNNPTITEQQAPGKTQGTSAADHGWGSEEIREEEENFSARLRAWEALNTFPDEAVKPTGESEKFIYIERTHTRMGNALFEFISGLAIGRTLNRTVLFSRGFLELTYIFSNTKKYMRMAPMSVNSGLVPLPLIMETGAGLYDDWIYHSIPTDRNVKLCCYFQSYKYFQNISDEVREMLRMKPSHLNHVSNFMQHIVYNRKIRAEGNSEPLVFVGVHIRRGDMATTAAKKSGRLSTPKKFIYKAINYYRARFKNVHFIVCSDDIQWCQNELGTFHYVIDDITFSSSNDALFDLAVLSQCDHSIMTVGTFGWWGSWLANGSVVYYDYQNIPGSYFGRRLRNDDFFPPTWLPMTSL